VGFDSQNYQISEVAEIIRSALGGIPIFTDDSNLDARDYRVSFTKLKQMLGVEPRQTIEGACRTIFEKLETAEIRNPAQKIYYNHYFDSAEE
jgi:nucleoside-diphosphate-sugar epimerase